MNKLKVSALLIGAVFAANFSKAQTIEDGRKSLYYEKYKTAAATFQALVNANPANVDAAYWLGQTYLRNVENPDVAKAKALYQGSLMANSSSPLLTAAMGHIALLENRTADARSQFETAFNMSQGKNIAVLNAIGFANVNALNATNGKSGDASYAIDKLKLATTIKGFKDADVYINLGDAYRKFEADGANPVKSFQAALQIDPNYAKALMRIGKIYESQGAQQFDLFTQYYEDAVTKDPAYAPAFYALYNAYYSMEGHVNIPKAGEYLEKYLANTEDPNSSENCYYRASQLFAQAKFTDCIAKAKECIGSGGPDTYVKLYGLLAYCNLKIGDSVNAKASFDTYFQKQKPELLGPSDYLNYAITLLKFPGNETLAGTMIEKAVQLDSTEAGKVVLLKAMAVYFENNKMLKDAGDWYKRIVQLKKSPSKTDIFNAGYNYYKAGSFQDAIDQWAMYNAKFPDDVFGYDMKGRAERMIDSTLANGLANASFQKVVDLGEAQWATDSAKIKTQLFRAYKYFIEYNANVKNDRPAAVTWCDRYLLKDPNDVEVNNFRKALSAPVTPPRTTPATRPGTTRPATGTGTRPANKTTTAPPKKK